DGGPGSTSRIPLERVRRQMGLPQDEPPHFPQYRRDDVEAPLPAPQPLGSRLGCGRDQQ
ncbi:hypothetical protein KI387_008459, partial [Taxus chinensis]